MRKVIIVFILVAITSIARSQDLLNLLNYTELEIKAILPTYGANFSGIKYSNGGYRYLDYQYSITQMKTNGSILSAMYSIDDNHKCDLFMVLYTDMNTLEDKVNYFNTKFAFKKVENSFGWINTVDNYDVEISISDDRKCYTLIYRQRK